MTTSINKPHYFAKFKDGTILSSDQMSWSKTSEKIIADKGGCKKTVFVNKLPIDTFYIECNKLSKMIDVPAGYRVFYSTSAETTFSNGEARCQILGRTVGLVNGEKIIEEYFLNAELNEVTGYKYI